MDISAANAFAIRALSQPGSVVGPEKPYPGRDGTTTWNARDGSPPCARGSVSGPIIPANSSTEPGQPCRSSSGTAAGSSERTCRKWMFCPSMVVVYCGIWLSRASWARQSYPVRHRSASRCTTPSGMP